MGVQGLLGVVKPYREQFTYGVVNADLDEDFDYKYFLLDGSCWLWNIMKGNILMDFGFVRRRAKNMVEKFKIFGFKLIVFIDANITNNKLDTWLSRRAERVEMVYAINHKIKSSKGNVSGFNYMWFAPCGAYFFCGQIFESLGCKVIYAHVDCDREMYGYYLLNNPYEDINGIVGFDTDFLIFNFPLYLEFPSMTFNKSSNTLSFYGYQHHRLLNRLRCKQRQLPHIASVMGCDVTNRLQKCGGNIDYAVRIVKETESSIKLLAEMNKKKKGYFGDDINGFKRRFNLADTFYSGICPLEIFKHPYLIQLLFQDYNERMDKCMLRSNKENKLNNKNASPYYYFKGVILDICMDDSDLIKNQKESSSIITLQLRKWLYKYILNDLKTDIENDKFCKMLKYKELRMKELICYSAPRLCFQTDKACREWLKGVTVDVFEDDKHMNPLFNLESYKFVKDVIEMDTKEDENDSKDDIKSDDNVLCIEIPEEYMIRDIIYLLTYLKDLDKNLNGNKDEKIDENLEEDEKQLENDRIEKNEQRNKIEVDAERVPFVFGIGDQVSKISETNDTEKDEKTKVIKKDKKPKKRGKRIRGGKKRNKNKNKNKNTKQEKDDEIKTNGNKKNKKKTKKKNIGLKIWDGFSLFINSFLYQWKYRNIFIKENDELELNKNKHKEFGSYASKINNRSMHYRSILFSIYELIYVFLQIEFKHKWFPKYYCKFLRYHYNQNHKQNGKKENKNKTDDIFNNIPKLRLLNGIHCDLQKSYDEDCECNNCKIASDIHEWKHNVIFNNDGDNNNEIEIDLQIPYVWQILNTRLFHWIWAYHSKAKKWIDECCPNEI